MFKKFSPPFLAFLQTTGLVVYIIFIDLFFRFVIPQFASKQSDTEFFGPLIMLTLFVMSAVISATLILGRAGVLFWEKRYKESFTLIGWTVMWGFIYLATFVVYILSLK